MQTFQTSGRLGDCIYQLYTIKAMGGGEIIVDLDHHKDPPEKWNRPLAETIQPLLEYQSYITSVSILSGLDFQNDQRIDWIDMVDAERAPMDPLSFPEWTGPNWPGNIHLAKRYAHHFGVAWKPGSIWLDAPKTRTDLDILVHAPMRRTTGYEELSLAIKILAEQEGAVVAIIDMEEEWHSLIGTVEIVKTRDLLQAATMINSAKVFLGAVSSCHAIAEALGKPRLVQQAPDCDNVNSTHVLNGLNARQIVELVERYL